MAAGDPSPGSLDYGSFPARILLPPGTFNPTQETVNEVGIISDIRGGTSPTGFPLFTLQTSAVTPVTIGAGNVAFFGSAGAGADQVANLPAATGSGFLKIIKKQDANAHYIVVTAAGADLIDGFATFSVGTTQYDAIAIIDSAAGVWRVIWSYVP